MNFYNILITYPFNDGFTYACSQKLEEFTIVEIDFRNNKTIGLVLNEVQPPENIEKIKEITTILPHTLRRKQMEFLTRLASYTVTPLGLALKLTLSSTNIFGKESKLPKPLIHQPSNNLADLNAEQKAAADHLIKALGNYSVTLLDGVTGSGKTEVYLEAINHCITHGKQALVLIPEIVLTNQLVERFTARFGFRPLEWHSGLTPKAKRDAWKQVYASDAKFIVGARSSLFLPFKNLDMIIVDEEHDQSFKQEEQIIYNARDMAILKASIEKIPIVLCSATPSIESKHNVETGKYTEITLTARYGKSSMPKIELIQNEKKTIVSNLLKKELLDNFNAGNQSLIFLNRRGYATVTLCGECWHKIMCPNCNFNLVEHKGKKQLKCHYCGYSDNSTLKCKNCESTEKFSSVGIGVEKVEEEINRIIPDARTLVLSSDTLSTRNKVDQALQDIEERKIDIIIGTQLVSKGLHFPKLELVGILDADAGINGGDLRALERAYQLLYQVAGRAGRESQIGKVLIQSNDTSNIVLQNLAYGDRKQFIASELSDRKAAFMPPFSRIVLLNFQSRKEPELAVFCNTFAKSTPIVDGIKILGPSPAPIFLMNRYYRYRFIIIANKELNVQKIISQWLAAMPIPRQIRAKVDVDPYSFL